jgi:NADH-quinone oxidoreductase subunit L
MNDASFPLYWIPLLPLLGAAFNLLLGRKLSRRAVHFVACGSVLGALLVGLVATCRHLYTPGHAVGGSAPVLLSTAFDWIVAGNVSIKMGLILDRLSAVMVFTVTFVGFLIHVYSMGYMHHDRDYARFFGYLNLFTGAMLLLVLGDNLVVLFVGWEGVGLCSYLLIGFWYDKDGTDKPGDANASAGRKAFIVNRVGDFAFLLGMFLLFSTTGTLNIGELSGKTGELLQIVGQVWSPFGPQLLTVAAAASFLLLIGATGKSAQIPLYVWLPDAMAGPTPVSALIHAATMVTAGVYMVARLNFIFMLSPTVMGIVALVGAVTALYAATIGFAQNDIKKVLAYSTISQLGYMFVAVGVGAFSAGIFHLFTHAFFKACLFLGAGSVIHAMSGKQDIREMGGLSKKLPITHWTFLISCLAIAGIFPLSGFFSKDEILWKALSTGNPGWPHWFPVLIYGLCLAGALCTAFYMFRLYFLTFSGECRADEHTRHHIHESPVSMTMPLAVLATGAAILGVLGLPGATGLRNFFHHWLEPVTDRGYHLVSAFPVVSPVHETALSHSHVAEWGLMALSLAIAVSGILVARSFYRGGASAQVQTLVAKLGWFHRLVRDKYRIDELYHFLIVRRVIQLAAFLWKAVDAFVIDLLGVNGSAWVVDMAGRISRRLHNGNVQRYVAAFVTGLAVIVVSVAWPPDSFVVKMAMPAERGGAATVPGALRPGAAVSLGQRVVFNASRGGEVDRRELEYQWDFEGDGKYSTWSPSAVESYVFVRKGAYTVRLRVKDRRWQTLSTESKKLEVR